MNKDVILATAAVFMALTDVTAGADSGAAMNSASVSTTLAMSVKPISAARSNFVSLLPQDRRGWHIKTHYEF